MQTQATTALPILSPRLSLILSLGRLGVPMPDKAAVQRHKRAKIRRLYTHTRQALFTLCECSQWIFFFTSLVAIPMYFGKYSAEELESRSAPHKPMCWWLVAVVVMACVGVILMAIVSMAGIEIWPITFLPLFVPLASLVLLCVGRGLSSWFFEDYLHWQTSAYGDFDPGDIPIPDKVLSDIRRTSGIPKAKVRIEYFGADPFAIVHTGWWFLNWALGRYVYIGAWNTGDSNLDTA